MNHFVDETHVPITSFQHRLVVGSRLTKGKALGVHYTPIQGTVHADKCKRLKVSPSPGMQYAHQQKPLSPVMTTGGNSRYRTKDVGRPSGDKTMSRLRPVNLCVTNRAVDPML